MLLDMWSFQRGFGLGQQQQVPQTEVFVSVHWNFQSFAGRHYSSATNARPVGASITDK